MVAHKCTRKQVTLLASIVSLQPPSVTDIVIDAPVEPRMVGWSYATAAMRR